MKLGKWSGAQERENLKMTFMFPSWVSWNLVVSGSEISNRITVYHYIEANTAFSWDRRKREELWIVEIYSSACSLSSDKEYLREGFPSYNFSKNIPGVSRNNLETNAKAVITINTILFQVLLSMNVCCFLTDVLYLFIYITIKLLK